ncbi:hypothetical protein F5Y18DRAFT_308167 [Xylariaceae sp. FL1019]|nr:hypothetical protein F5Y18DRAFT_308167 [Xylariaceae sp. FL1019]
MNDPSVSLQLNLYSRSQVWRFVLTFDIDTSQELCDAAFNQSRLPRLMGPWSMPMISTSIAPSSSSFSWIHISPTSSASKTISNTPAADSSTTPIATSSEVLSTQPSLSTPIQLSTHTKSGITTTTERPITLTTLPSDVSFVTLSNYDATTPIYTTTTSPGGSDPTVVPVIIPFDGPPKLCFGCYTSFPPNIQISLPELCIRLFGIDIGNCPESTDSPDPTSGDHDPTKSDNDPTKPTRSTSSTASCTSSLTATYESVFCTVTNEQQTRTAEQCSTKVYSMVTGCSVTASTATTTTTIHLERATDVCSPNTCGKLSCPLGNPARLLSRRAPGDTEIQHMLLKDRAATSLRAAKRGESHNGDWTDPSDYSSPEMFVAHESFFSYQARDAINEPQQSVRINYDEFIPVTSETVTFKNEVVSIAVQGLYGCTAVVAVSRRGAWASHMFEDPTFRRDFITSNPGYEDIYEGLDQTGPFYAWHKYGLTQLRGRTNLPDGLGQIFGDTLSDDTASTQVFIVTPRERVPAWRKEDEHGNLEDLVDEQGQHIDDDVLLAEDANADSGPLYPRSVEILSLLLNDLLGSQVPVNVVTYSPKVETLAQAKMKLSPAKKAEVLGDDNQKEPRGKVLLQYQPGKCDRQASWRLWVEKQPEPVGSDSWDALDAQIWTGSQQQQKRDEGGSCSRSSSSSSSTSLSSQTSASSTPFATSSAAPTTTPAVGTCTPDTVAQDCKGPAFICTGHTSTACEDGKCVCNSPPPPSTTVTSSAMQPSGTPPPGSCTPDTIAQDCAAPSFICTGHTSPACEAGKCTCKDPVRKTIDVFIIWSWSQTWTKDDTRWNETGSWVMYTLPIENVSHTLLPCIDSPIARTIVSGDDFGGPTIHDTYPRSAVGGGVAVEGFTGCNYAPDDDETRIGRFTCDGGIEFTCFDESFYADPESEKDSIRCDKHAPDWESGSTTFFDPQIRCQY